VPVNAAFLVVRRVMIALLGCLLMAGAAADDLQVIELKYRLADEVIPVVQPLIEQGGVVTGSDRFVFVRTSPGNFAQVRDAVAALDRPPRQLVITVGQGTVSDRSAAEVRGAASIDAGGVHLGVNQPPGSATGATIVAGAGAQQEGLRSVSQVRTVEGSEAYVAMGQSVPLTTTVVAPGWSGPAVQRTTEYRSASTGFYATARIRGDRVTLEIASRQQSLGDRRGTVDTRGVQSVLTGRLGEWMPIGAVHESSSAAEQGLLVWGTRSGSSEYSAWVKVEELP
jgi:hypothetical protein